jgi:two-component system chemotaxis response regulator CheY
MPDLNGIQLTKEVRQIPQYKRMPILMLTSEKDTEKKLEALKNGVTAIVQKPFEREEFIKTVKRALNLF